MWLFFKQFKFIVDKFKISLKWKNYRSTKKSKNDLLSYFQNSHVYMLINNISIIMIMEKKICNQEEWVAVVAIRIMSLAKYTLATFTYAVFFFYFVSFLQPTHLHQDVIIMAFVCVCTCKQIYFLFIALLLQMGVKVCFFFITFFIKLHLHINKFLAIGH